MLKNFIVTTYRNLTRNKFLSILNIGGLGIGIAAFLLIVQYVIWENSYDTFHADSKNIYRVSQLFLKEGQLNFHAGATFATVGPAMKDDFPEVKEYCRLFRKWRGGIVNYEEKSFRENDIIYADPSFFNIFGYPLISGNPDKVLSEPHTAVIDKEAATKYFGGGIDPIGKRISVGSMMGIEEFEITGIFEAQPNSHIAIDLLLSYSSAVSVFGSDVERSWGWWDFHTYVLLDPNTDTQALSERFPAFADKYGGERNGSTKVGFELQPIEDIHLKSHLRHELAENGNSETVNFLSIISIFIIAIAWINYINLTTAKAFNRAKEVGIRKTMGSLRWQLATQFLTESLVVNFIAIVAGMMLFHLSLPVFYELIGRTIPVNYYAQPVFWIQVAIIWIAGSAISGFYPAWVISSFDPKTALQSSNARHGHKANMRRVLVTFQFMASASLIAGTLVVYSQLTFMQSQDKGINTENILTISAPEVMDGDGESYHQKLTTYRSLIANHSAVSEVSLSSDIPGEQVSWMGGARRMGRSRDEYPSNVIYKHTVDIEYLDLYENQFLAGRNFDKSSDSIYVIINKEAMNAFGFESPEAAINQRLSISLVDTLAILAVIDNFHQEALREGYKPTLYLLIDDEKRHFSAKISEAGLPDFLNYAEASYLDIFPEGVFQYKLVNDHIQSQYQSEDTFLSTFLVFAGLAIVIALLGLTGLAFYTTEQRSKEVSIRKVLGSSTSGVFMLLCRDMLKHILVANLLALPIILYYSNQWLEGFAFRENFNYSVLAASLLLTLGSGLAIISFHVMKAALINPIVALRNE